MLNPDLFEISEILAAKAIGAITPGQQRILDKWLGESEANRAAYDKFISGEEIELRTWSINLINSEDFIRNVGKKIAKRNKVRALVRRASVAAVVVAGIVLSLLPDRNDCQDDENRTFENSKPTLSINGSNDFVLINDGENEWIQIVEAQAQKAGILSGDTMNVRINVPRGGFYNLKLKDGTHVWLNAETTIEYPVKFASDKREVHIIGEAYFEVMRDPGKPFVITTTDNVGVKVLGTKLNISSYADEPDIKITLVEGSVDVVHNDRRVRLTPNKQAVFDRSVRELSVKDIVLPEFLAWKDGMFDFRFASFIGMLKTIERAYDIEFVINGVDISSFGEFMLTTDRSDNFAQVLNILRRITGLNFRAEGRKVFVTDI